MPQLKVPLSGHVFHVVSRFSKVTSNNSKAINSIIDTGASVTCVSFSMVQQLGISPSGPFSLAGTASGEGFTRPYPIEINLDNKIKKIISCSVLFQPVPFVHVASKTEFITLPEIRAIATSDGRPMPEAILERSSRLADGTYSVTVFQPGIGVEQPVALLGMNFLADFDWSFLKATQELTVSY